MAESTQNTKEFPWLEKTNQRSFVYPYPSVSVFAGRNSDHDRSKTRAKNQTTPDSVVTGGKEKLRPWPKFVGKETQTMVWVCGVFGVGVDGGGGGGLIRASVILA